MELLDIVNANDEIIGTMNRDAAHTAGALHRIAAVFVFNESGQLYVQVRKSSGNLYDHSVGGHVSSGETYAVAASRETKEELGIALPLQELSIFNPNYAADSMHIFGLYTCTVELGWQFAPNQEVEEVIAMEVEDVQKLMIDEPDRFTRGFIATMKEYARLKPRGKAGR
jgi:isopentenyl-diphosphate delta-isomerase